QHVAGEGGGHGGQVEARHLDGLAGVRADLELGGGARRGGRGGEGHRAGEGGVAGGCRGAGDVEATTLLHREGEAGTGGLRGDGELLGQVGTARPEQTRTHLVLDELGELGTGLGTRLAGGDRLGGDRDAVDGEREGVA